MHGCTYSTRQHWEANTPRPNHPTHASTQVPSTASAVLLVSCSYSTQFYISTRRSVDHNQSWVRAHRNSPPARDRILITKTFANREEWTTNNQTAFLCISVLNPPNPPIPGISAIYISRTLKSKTVQKQWNLISPPKKVFYQISLYLNNFLVCAENNILIKNLTQCLFSPPCHDVVFQSSKK